MQIIKYFFKKYLIMILINVKFNLTLMLNNYCYY